MKKMLVAVVLCVMLAGFAFAATTADVTVNVTVSSFAEIECTTDGVVNWTWTEPLAETNYLDPETESFVARANGEYKVTCDQPINYDAGNFIISHDFTSALNVYGEQESFDVTFSNDFYDETNGEKSDWWNYGPTDTSVVYTFTIEAI